MRAERRTLEALLLHASRFADSRLFIRRAVQLSSMRLSIKTALLGAAACVIPVAISSLILLPPLSAEWREKAAGRRQESLRASAAILEKRLGDLRSATQRLAEEVGFAALSEGTGAAGISPARSRVQDLLARARDEYALDFLLIADPKGRITARNNDVPGPSEDLLQPEHANALAEMAIASGSRQQGTAIAAAAVEGGLFLKRMWLDKIAVVKTDGGVMNEALMLEAAAPVFVSGRFAGIVLVGQMLNNYHAGLGSQLGAATVQTPLIAEIKQILRPEPEEDWGALVALREVIIASGLRNGRSGEPLLKGARHDLNAAEESFKAEDRVYSAAWLPIKSARGDKIGALGVATAAAEIVGPAQTARNSLMAVAIGALVAGGLLGLLFGGAISSRINRLIGAVNRMSLGELSVSISDRVPRNRSNNDQTNGADVSLEAAVFEESEKTAVSSEHDEIERLAEQLDFMRESFRQAIERIRRR